MAAPSPRSGGMLGRYRILEQIGAGGMGVVFRARDERLARDVAIKILHPGSIRSSIAKHRVRNEALALSRLNHPNVETIFEFDSHEDCDYLVMEFIPGVSLDELMKAGPLPQAQAISLMVQLLRGLAAAHEKGIIHRDLKPSNLRLTPDGFLKILDFGLAHCADSDVQASEFTTETHSTVLAGTLAYMSPEQLRNAPLDPRCDIYAAGLIFYQMCTGQPCFTESGAVLIDAIFNRPVVSPSKINKQVGSRLAAVILKALEKDANARYQSAREMLGDVEALESAAPIWEKRKLYIGAATLILFVAASLAALERRQLASWIDRQLHPVPSNKYVAVMPFRSLENDDPAFDQGLTEAVAAKLMEITAAQAVQVVSPRELQAEHVTDVGDARRKLGVNLAIAGTFQQIGGATRVNLELVDTATRRLLWAAPFTATASDAFALQDQVVENVVRMLETEMHQDLGERGHGTTNSEAFTLYTRGVGFLEKGLTPEDVDSAIGQFEQALKIDPGYAAASARLGLAYFEKYGLTKEASLVSRARSACEHALALSRPSAEGNICLGTVHRGTGESQAAVSDFQLAIESDPENDDAYRELASAYVDLGRMQDAEATYKKAILMRPQYAAGYDRLGDLYRREAKYSLAIEEFKKGTELAPQDARQWSSLGGTYYYSGEYGRSIDALQKAISIRPSFQAYSNLGLGYLALRRFPEAIAAFEQAVAMGSHTIQTYGNLGRAYFFYAPKHDDARIPLNKALELAADDLRVNPRDADVHTLAGQYCAMLGRKSDALRHLSTALELRPNDAETLYFAAIIHAQLGNQDTALDWLQKAVNLGYSPAEIASTADLDVLRQLPRFKSILSVPKRL